MSAAKGQYISTTYTTPAENDIRTIRINAAGELMVAASGGVAGGATAALQTTGNTSLSNIDADLELLKQPNIAATVTTHDSTAQVATKGLWVGTGGNITGRLSGDGADRVWKNIPSGTYVPGNFVLIKTATTAADILAYS